LPWRRRRFQVCEAFAVTFDVQFIANPALNPNKDMTDFFCVRFRLAL
jgi:hypothetical protein